MSVSEVPGIQLYNSMPRLRILTCEECQIRCRCLRQEQKRVEVEKMMSNHETFCYFARNLF